MESKFITLIATGKEVEWLRDLLKISFYAKPISAVSLHCDSEATLARAYSGTYNGKFRHISLRHDFVRQLIQDGIIAISYVKSTKHLTRGVVRTTSRGMGLKLFSKDFTSDENPT